MYDTEEKDQIAGMTTFSKNVAVEGLCDVEVVVAQTVHRFLGEIQSVSSTARVMTYSMCTDFPWYQQSSGVIPCLGYLGLLFDVVHAHAETVLDSADVNDQRVASQWRGQIVGVSVGVVSAKDLEGEAAVDEVVVACFL